MNSELVKNIDMSNVGPIVIAPFYAKLKNSDANYMCSYITLIKKESESKITLLYTDLDDSYTGKTFDDPRKFKQVSMNILKLSSIKISDDWKTFKKEN